MSVLKKIMTAVRGGAREVGELIVDSNGTRIFEQEIKDAETHLRKAKQDLTDVMAKQMQAGRKVESLKNEITEHEGYVTQALEKSNEDLALEIAEKIAQLEDFIQRFKAGSRASQTRSRSKQVERLRRPSPYRLVHALLHGISSVFPKPPEVRAPTAPPWHKR